MTDDLPAGRALDALVAEKVMGWRWVAGEHWDVTSVRDPRWLLPPNMGVGDVGAGEWTFYDENVNLDWGDSVASDNRLTLYALPEYSTEIASAWDVVEKLRGERPMLSLHLVAYAYNRTYAVFALTGEGPDDDWSEGNGEHATPLAICRAALKAVGAESDPDMEG